MTASKLVEHFFRHEYGRLVAVLTRRVGMEHVEAVEDAAQNALMKALNVWTTSQIPENPTAWLFRVAHNELIGELRRKSGRRQLLEQHPTDLLPAADDEPDPLLPGEVQDELLRMLFACCDESVPSESQVVLALKTLCGFSVSEIALRLFTSDEKNVYKRLSRARSRLRNQSRELGNLSGEQYASRVPAVHKIIYLLFTEGYLSAHDDVAIRRELCDEAIRLATLLAEHPIGSVPETCALLALMHLHVARMTARQDAAGGLLLLEEQDRSLWDRDRIEAGMEWLARSAEGEAFSRYHAEAGIAAEHCLAPSFEQTRWDRIVQAYDLFEDAADSPLHTLNRAVAIAEWQGPDAGLAVLEHLDPPKWLARSYLWFAVLADLHRRSGNGAETGRYREAALRLAPTAAVKKLLERRLGDRNVA